MNGFSQYKKNAFVFEVLGKSCYYFDISYERNVTERIHIGSGIGLAGIHHLYYIGGDFHKVSYSIPIYVAYSFGQKKHRLISEIGMSILGNTTPYSLLSFSDVTPFISAGYEYKGEHYVFRVPVYFAYVGRNEFFPSVMPWIGVSFGRLF
jgi:Protein of unknown function (DUF3187).